MYYFSFLASNPLGTTFYFEVLLILLADLPSKLRLLGDFDTRTFEVL